jgi:FkbM family methyltransferase
MLFAKPDQKYGLLKRDYMTINSYHQKINIFLAQNVESLISAHAKKMTNLLKENGESFILFGAGRLGKIALTGLREAGVEPLAFADNSPDLWGQRIDGVEVLSPKDAKQRYGKRAVFVTTVYTNAPVRLQLERLEVEFISFADLAWNYSDILLPHYATDLPYAIFEQADDVKQALDVWADDMSRNEYLSQLAWRVSLDPSVLPPSLSPQEMYFQKDLFSFLTSDTLVDCGAFDGDTIRELERQMILYRGLIAIEPDPINFHKLEEYVSSLPEDLRGKIQLHQNALGPIRERINFDATGTASTIMDFGSYMVESIPLDEVLANERPTYIKMDIEGAEYQALSGGRHIISKYRPILAICLYHRQEDLWRIPLLIRSMSDSYHLFLRRYSDECWEQVCYAIPKERVVV